MNGKVSLSLIVEAVSARPRSVASAIWIVGPIKGKWRRETHGHLTAAFRCLSLRERSGTSASQGNELKKGSYCASPSARWPKAELEPSAWELSFSYCVISCAQEECPHEKWRWQGEGEGQEAMWMGWHCALPAVREWLRSLPGTSLLRQCKLFLWLLETGMALHFSPRTEAREEGCWCLCSHPLLFSQHRRGGSGDWVLSSECTACNTTRLY